MRQEISRDYFGDADHICLYHPPVTVGPYALGATNVTLTATDDQGATDMSTAAVTVVDLSKPVPDLPALPVVSGQCSASVSSIPTATDNCSGAVAGTTTDPLNYSQQGTFTVNWTFQDGSGNASTQTQTVIVQDTTAPVIQRA